MKTFIHPSSLISEKALIGEGVRIGPFCYVADNVRIGAGTILRSSVKVLDFVEIGRECNIHENVVIGGDPQDTSFHDEETWVLIGDRNTLRENVTIHRSTGKGTSTRVGNDCFLMEGVHIGHNAVVGDRVTMANKVGLSGFSQVGDGTVLGGISGLHQFVKIGRYCMIGGLSKIVKDIPPFLLVDGHPGKIYNINRVGLKRAGFTTQQRKHIVDIYKFIYHGGLPLRSAVDEAEKEFSGSGIAMEIVEFMRNSKRGVEFWTSRSRCREGD